jgi:hypothetical protein
MISHQLALDRTKPLPAFEPRRPHPAAFPGGGRTYAASAYAAHDFGSIRVHPPASAARLADDAPCASGRVGMNGGTGCDASTGKTVTTIYDPPECYRHCVVKHEAVHAHDIAPCCARSNAAYKAAKSDDDRQAVQDKFNQWMLNNRDWLECRAYTESAKCGKAYVDQNCGSKKQGAASSPDLPGREPEPPVSLQPLEAGQPGQPPGGEPTAGPHNMVADSVPDGAGASKTPGNAAGGDAGAPGPEDCCPKLLCYWRVSQGRSDNVCGGAPKALSRCPF